MHDNIWVAKVAELVLVQRLHKTKIKRQKQNNNNSKKKKKNKRGEQHSKIRNEKTHRVNTYVQQYEI